MQFFPFLLTTGTQHRSRRHVRSFPPIHPSNLCPGGKGTVTYWDKCWCSYRGGYWRIKKKGGFHVYALRSGGVIGGDVGKSITFTMYIVPNMFVNVQHIGHAHIMGETHLSICRYLHRVEDKNANGNQVFSIS